LCFRLINSNNFIKNANVMLILHLWRIIRIKHIIKLSFYFFNRKKTIKRNLVILSITSIIRKKEKIIYRFYI